MAINIPIYSAPTVAARGFQQAELNPNVPNGLGALGQGMDMAAQAIKEANARADSIRAEDQYNKLQLAANDLKTQALQRVGIDAIRGTNPDHPESITSEFGGKLDAKIAELDGELANPQQKAMFKRLAGREVVSVQSHLQAHEAQQMKVYRESVAAGSVLAEATSAAKDPYNFENISMGLARVGRLVDETTAGLAPEQRDAIRLERQGAVVKSQIDSLIEGDRKDFKTARAALDTHKGSIPESLFTSYVNRLQKETESQAAADMASAAAANAHVAYAKKDDWEQASKDMTDSAEFKGLSAKMQDHARMLFRSHREEYFSQKKIDHQETEGQAWLDYAKGGYKASALLTSPAFKKLEDNPETAHIAGSMREHVRDRQKADSRPEPLTPAQVVAAYATYQKILDSPAELMKMSDLQIASMTGTLGSDLTKQLMDAKRKTAGSLDAMKAQSLSDIPFRDIAAEYGLKVKGTMTDVDHARLGKLRDKVLSAVRYEQEVTGKIATPERKEEILRSYLVTAKTKKPGDWFSHDSMLFEVDMAGDIDATVEEKMKAAEILTQTHALVNPVNMSRMVQKIREKAKR